MAFSSRSASPVEYCGSASCMASSIFIFLLGGLQLPESTYCSRPTESQILMLHSVRVALIPLVWKIFSEILLCSLQLAHNKFCSLTDKICSLVFGRVFACYRSLSLSLPDLGGWLHIDPYQNEITKINMSGHCWLGPYKKTVGAWICIPSVGEVYRRRQSSSTPPYCCCIRATASRPRCSISSRSSLRVQPNCGGLPPAPGAIRRFCHTHEQC